MRNAERDSDNGVTPVAAGGPFPAVLGQAAAADEMGEALKSGRLAHAYIFSGPEGVGKFRFAKELAKALVCRGSGARPCGTCSACGKIERETHPEMIVLRVQPENQQIKIEAVRDACSRLMLKPVEAKHRICIIDEAERLSDDGANCLLKTLEEPPDYCVIALVTSRPEMLLPTVRSRCRTVRFGALDPENIVRILIEKTGMAPERALSVARISCGSAGAAIALAGEDVFGLREGLLRRLESLPNVSPCDVSDELTRGGEGDASASGSDSRGKRLRALHSVDLLILLARDALVECVSPGSGEIVNEDLRPQLGSLGVSMGSDGLLDALESLVAAHEAIEGNANARLAVEELFFELRGASASQTAR
jgi:DNA polymerase-3 subunit delta'